jgi:hypothetical protein
VISPADEGTCQGEASKYVLNIHGDLEGLLILAHCHGIDRESRLPDDELVVHSKAGPEAGNLRAHSPQK